MCTRQLAMAGWLLLVSLPAPAAQEPRLVATVPCSECASGDDLAPLALSFAHDRIVVLNAFPPHVRVFDREGRPLADLGNQGEGPGELTGPVAIFGSVETSEVFVADGMPPRLVAFDIAAMGHLDVVRLPFRMMTGMSMDRQGHLYTVSFMPGEDDLRIDRHGRDGSDVVLNDLTSFPDAGIARRARFAYALSASPDGDLVLGNAESRKAVAVTPGGKHAIVHEAGGAGGGRREPDKFFLRHDGVGRLWVLEARHDATTEFSFYEGERRARVSLPRRVSLIDGPAYDVDGDGMMLVLAERPNEGGQAVEVWQIPAAALRDVP